MKKAKKNQKKLRLQLGNLEKFAKESSGDVSKINKNVQTLEKQIKRHSKKIESFLQSIGHKFESKLGSEVEGVDPSEKNTQMAGEIVGKIEGKIKGIDMEVLN